MTLHPPRARSTAAVLLLATWGLLGLVARPAAAADGDVPWSVTTADNTFGADRQDYSYTVNPGGQVADGLVVVNNGTTPLHLALKAADGITNGAGELDLVTKDATSTGLGAWVRLDRGDVTVAPGESAAVPFTVTLPKDAAAGDYVGGILTTQARTEVGIRIRLRVGGALKPSLAVENVHVDYAHTSNPIAKGDATVTYAIHNTGNAILNARQSVSVSGPFGLSSVAAEQIADSPPLLPGESWKVSAPLHDVIPALRLTATVTLIPLATDAAGSTAPLAATKASGHALIVPWSLLAVIIVLCGLVVAGLAFRSRRRDGAPH
jgi:hypothetical protein